LPARSDSMLRIVVPLIPLLIAVGFLLGGNGL
jgi:hypothetical protein